MQPRHIPAIIIVLIAACSPKPDSASSVDSLATDSWVAESPSIQPAVAVRFTDNELFTKFLPFDPTDRDAWAAWFPGDDGDCEGFDNEDGTPWYRLCSYTGDSLAATFYDFYDTEPQRFYYYEIRAINPAVEFAKGIHVGMSRTEFIEAVDLADPAAAESREIWAYQDPGEHSILFEFAEDNLATVTINFNYDSIPKTIVDFANTWTEVYINEGEGEVETHVPCEYQYFILEEAVRQGDYDGPTKYLLSIGGPQDVRVDTVQSIKRTGDGFVISARYPNNPEPYTRRVIFNDYSWTLAEWEGTLCASDGYSGQRFHDQCPEEQP